MLTWMKVGVLSMDEGALRQMIAQHGNAIDATDDTGLTALHTAAQIGFVEALEILVEAGSTAIDKPSSAFLWTPMHCAAMGGHVAVIEALFRLGSRSVDALARHGRTPLELAVSRGHAGAAEALVRLGSQAIDITDQCGRTPMYSAIRSASGKGCVLLLRSLGAECSLLEDGLSDEMQRLFAGPLDEEQVAEVNQTKRLKE